MRKERNEEMKTYRVTKLGIGSDSYVEKYDVRAEALKIADGFAQFHTSSKVGAPPTLLINAQTIEKIEVIKK